MKKPDEPRRVLLERLASTAGECWAVEQIVTLRSEHRPIVGGWPGTMGEARGRSRAFVTRSLGELGAPVATAAEFELAARATYAKARVEWNANAERDGAEAVEDPR